MILRILYPFIDRCAVAYSWTDIIGTAIILGRTSSHDRACIYIRNKTNDTCSPLLLLLTIVIQTIATHIDNIRYRKKYS